MDKSSKIALWGYGVFGKYTEESIKRYWDGAYEVTKIYDIKKRAWDQFLELQVSDPADIVKDYHTGLPEKVMICIQDPLISAKVKKPEDTEYPVVLLRQYG